MSKKKYKPICKCGQTKNVIKFGKRNNIQRFYCKECKKTFLEKKRRIEYQLKDKIFLSMLKNFLKPTATEIAITDAISNISNELMDIDNFRLMQRVSTDKEVIFCYNPRIMICEDGDDIIIYRFEKRDEETENSRSFKIIDQNERSRNRKQFTTQNKAE